VIKVFRHQDNVRIFMAFTDATRLCILRLLQDGEKTASDLLEYIGTGQSTLSHHMKILIDSGVVAARKYGKWTYYSICGAGARYAAGLLKLLTCNNIIGIENLNYADLSHTDAGYAELSKTNIEGENNMKPFTIFVDTSTDLSADFIKEHGIEVLPIPFTLDGVEHKQGYWQEISDKDFYERLKNGGVAKTAQINPDAFARSFKETAGQGKDAVYILLSGGLSGTYQSALIALNEVKETYPDCNIFPIDSVGATSVNTMLAVMAVQKRKEGLDAAQTAAWLQERKNNLLGFFTVDDLMYLHRGGRLSKISAIGGSILGIKPVLNLQPDGTLALKEKVRGRTAAFKLMVNQLLRSVKEGAELDTVYVTHTNSETDAHKLAELVKGSVKVKRVEIVTMGPVIGAHVGPGTVTLIFEADITRQEYEDRYYAKKVK
jgi:DegV family protein with EDD domain